MAPVDIERVRQEADRMIALAPTEVEIEFDDVCSIEKDVHSNKCQNTMGTLSTSCIMIEIEAARERKQNLSLIRLLRDCARDPSSASASHTLEGLAQESCILETE